MDALEKLRNLSRELAENYLSKAEFPAKAYSGSIGDPLGHVRSNSDVDVEVWCTKTENIENLGSQPVIDWKPHNYRWTTKRRPEVLVDKKYDLIMPGGIDVLKLQDGTDASITFFYLDEDNFKSMPQILNSNISQSNINDCYSPINFGLRHFCETTPIKDSTDVYGSCEEVTKRNFEENRSKYAQDFLDSRGEGGKILRLFLHKLKEDSIANENNEEVDLTLYNNRVSEIVDVLTYVRCLSQNIPRSYDSLLSKRKNNIWKALNMNQSKIFGAQVSSKDGKVKNEDIKESTKNIKYLTAETFENARKEFPEIVVPHVNL